MTKKTRQKRFDCLAYKDKVQAEIHEAIKDLSPAEQIEYIRRGVEAGPLGPWWRKVRAASQRRRAVGGSSSSG